MTTLSFIGLTCRFYSNKVVRTLETSGTYRLKVQVSSIRMLGLELTLQVCQAFVRMYPTMIIAFLVGTLLLVDCLMTIGL